MKHSQILPRIGLGGSFPVPAPENRFARAYRRFARLSWLGVPCHVVAANEESPLPVMEMAEMSGPADASVAATNESGERLLVPYGEFAWTWQVPGPDGSVRKVETVQVFDRQSADAIVSAHNSALAKFARSVTRLFGSAGVPVYYRHPDQLDDHVDKREYGRVESLRSGSDGLYGVLSYNEPGDTLRREVKGLRISPVWKMTPISSLEETPVRFRPIRMQSFGLTQFPNIPTAVGVNETNNRIHKMNELLKYLLSQLGFANERIEATTQAGSDAVSLTEVRTQFESLQTAANEAGKLTQIQTDLDQATKDKTELETRLTAANERADGLLGQLAEVEVEAAISAGKVTPAGKADAISKLVKADDFATAANELKAGSPAMKTTPVTDDLGTRQSQAITAANEASSTLDRMVADRQATGMSYDDAWSAVSASPDGKKLIDQLRAR